MADPESDETIEEDEPKKKSKLPLLIGLVLALAGGGGGFYATWSGMIMGGDSHAEADHDDVEHAATLPEISFIAIEPITISMRSNGAPKHLRFRAQLEVEKSAVEEVELLLPRVVDILNGYLRALEVADIEDVSSLSRLRSQMLRRVQMVMGEGRVNDLLIMEFVIT